MQHRLTHGFDNRHECLGHVAPQDVQGRLEVPAKLLSRHPASLQTAGVARIAAGIVAAPEARQLAEVQLPGENDHQLQWD